MIYKVEKTTKIVFAVLSFSCEALEASKFVVVLMASSFVIWLKEKTEPLSVFFPQNIGIIAMS